MYNNEQVRERQGKSALQNEDKNALEARLRFCTADFQRTNTLVLVLKAALINKMSVLVQRIAIIVVLKGRP